MAHSENLFYRYPSGRHTVSVRIATPELLSVLESFYPSYRCNEGEMEGIPTEITLERDNSSYRLTGPSGAWYAHEPGEAVALCEGELTLAFLRETEADVRLHGAAVCSGDECLLLIGDSGAGKSTLTLGLLVSGLQPLADDVVVIDPTSGCVQPFERSIRVHRTAAARLGVEPQRLSGTHVCEPFLWVGLEWMGAGRRKPRRPGAVVFIEPAARTVAEPLGATDTLRRLLVGRLGLGRPARNFGCFARLASEVPGYRLEYRNFREAVGELTRIAAAVE